MEALLTLVPTPRATRLLLTRGRDTLLKGRLPPLDKLLHARAAIALLEALSLWVDGRLCVALYADAPETCFRCGLTDELGVGARGLFYAVEVLAPRRRQAQPASDDSAQGHQLRLLAKPDGAP